MVGVLCQLEATVDVRPVRADGDGLAFCRALPELVGVVAVPTANKDKYREHASGAAPLFKVPRR